jgi:glycosyltransferase involved in cell wall biosynthesis
MNRGDAKNLIFVSDFFIDEVSGGAEFCNEALMQRLSSYYNIEKRKSRNILLGDSLDDFVQKNKNNFFIIANFFQLSEPVKKIMQNLQYAIIEHDHKYVSTNNPSLWKDFVAPESKIINKQFYRNARAVLCQSKKHSEILQKNLLINNIVNLAGNIWTDGQLGVLEKNIDVEKKIDFAIMRSANKNKGMPVAIGFCQKNNLDFHLLEHRPFPEFINELASVKNFVFFPQWFETYSRICIEAKIVGCKIVTNSMIGVASEEYFKLKGKELLEFVRENNHNVVKKICNVVDNDNIEFIPVMKVPKVTVFCPLYNGEKYIKHFLDDMVSQTIFDKCELIIIDANSPQNEKETIQEYAKKYENIVYKRLDYRASVMETENMALKLATGDYFAQCCVDDRHSSQYLEVLSKHLFLNDDIDLVYSDCLQTEKPNETFDSNSSSGALYEHSMNEFSRENMVKCLPGPMPMWKIKAHEKYGYFRDDMRYAGDWEMFLRMVKNGSKFKKVDIPLGLYYYNEDGLSTSIKHDKDRKAEEASVFFEYKDIFGESNFKMYKNYFSQFIK